MGGFGLSTVHNLPPSHKLLFTRNQYLHIDSIIGDLEVKEDIVMHISWVAHFVIRAKLVYLIGLELIEVVEWNAF